MLFKKGFLRVEALFGNLNESRTKLIHSVELIELTIHWTKVY